MSNKPEKPKVKYPCSRCGKGSSFVNDNRFDQKGELVCTRCAKDAPTETFIRFLRHSPPAISLSVGEITVWYSALTGRVSNAWVKYGLNGVNIGHNRPFPSAIRDIQAMLADNKAQCAACKSLVDRDTMKQARMHGSQCPDCYAKWEVKCEAEKKSGNTCLKCGVPRSACCC